MDKKPLPEDKRTGTNKDNLDPDAQPYMYIVYPQNVMDIAFDDNGNIKWALIKESYREDDDPFTADADIGSRYRLWQKHGWTLYDSKGKELANGELSGFVPIVTHDNEEGGYAV